VSLDPPVRGLLTAIVELEGGTRDLPHDDRDAIFAYLGGLLGTVVRGDASVQHAIEVLRGDGWQLLLPDPRRPSRR
jgi:hypothetical protein